MILCLETATSICSVALINNSTIRGIRESSIDKSHASLLTVFIQELLEENMLSATDLDAVAISKGPGSYTGLRIGVSAAKGICYGTGIPLIAVSTLESMFRSFITEYQGTGAENKDTLFCPMIDARRLEVYSSVFNYEGREIREVEAEIIDERSYEKMLDRGKIVFFGNGADKCGDIIKHKNAVFAYGFRLTATGMALPALKAFSEKKFEDTAYFEPYYLKDFIATIPRKNILGHE